MSVVATNAYSTATGNGATTSFPYTFPARNAADVAVYVNGTLQVAGFTVTPNIGANGGTVLFTSPPANLAAILFGLAPSFQQSTTFINAGAYNPASVDGANDQAAIRDIYLKGLLERAALVPLGETMGPMPAAASRIGKFFGFDGAGNPIALSGTGNDSALRTDLAASTGAGLVSFIQSGTGAVSRLSQDKLRDRISIKDYGAVGDGVTDNHAAVAAAAAAARGRQLYFPKGNYVINSDGGTITLEEVDLAGECVLDGATGTIDEGSMLWITGTTNSPFKVRRGVSVEGLGIYYPNQVDSATPTAYPATLLFDFSNGPVQFVSIRRNVVYNAYKFIDIGDVTGNIGHIEIEGNYICALNRAIYLRYNSEHFRVERNNFTFGHWLAATEAGARAYMRANATAFQVDQSDGVEFVDNLVFGHLNGVLASALGLCQLLNISDNKLDQCRYPIRATGVGRFDGHINGNTFNAYNSQNTALQGRSISIETTGTGLERVGIGNNNLALATEEHIFTSSDTPSRTLVISGANRFASWAAFKAAGLYGAINATGANTNVQQTGGHFYGNNSAAFSKGIVGTFNVLEVTGAFFDGCVAELDVNCGFVTSTGNRSFNTSGATSDIVVANDYVNGPNAWAKPSSKTKSVTAATYTVENRYGNFVVNFAGTVTLTLPSAATYNGPGLRLLTITANAVVSASSNVLPAAGGAAGTAILAATAGKEALLVPNGANWQIMAAN